MNQYIFTFCLRGTKYMPAKHAPQRSVTHTAKTTIVTYHHSPNTNSSVTNRPAVVYKSPTTTKVVYRKK